MKIIYLDPDCQILEFFGFKQQIYHKTFIFIVYIRLRPYHVENTRSRPISEVKLRRAQLVLTWVTGWEY